ncbi:MAG: C40 family peptidase [Burkholderiales bacterium]
MKLIVAGLMVMLAAGCSWGPSRDHGWTGTPDYGGAPPREYDAERSRDVVRHALGYVGIPYRYGGNSAATGFDCSGLVWRVYRQATGIRLPRDTYGISRTGTAIASRELRPGDLVFFNTMRRPYSHVGIYLGGDRFVHAPSSGGVVSVSHLSNRYWRQRFNGGRRIVY